MNQPLLEIKALGHAFGGIEVLQSVNFSVDAGSVTGIIGPNGAGKTTLFNMMSGLLKPQGGEIIFEGQSLIDRPPHQIARSGIARTFQNLRIFPEMSLLDNVIAGMHPHLRYNCFDALMNTHRKKSMEEKAQSDAHQHLERVGLDDLSDRQAGTLSYGAQRRLEIARALAGRPKLLLLDEPVAGMNPQESEELKHCLSSLLGHGLTIILIEHDMRFVMSLCEDIHVLNFGRMIASGAPEAIRNHPDVIEAYLGQGAHV